MKLFTSLIMLAAIAAPAAADELANCHGSDGFVKVEYSTYFGELGVYRPGAHMHVYFNDADVRRTAKTLEITTKEWRYFRTEHGSKLRNIKYEEAYTCATVKQLR